MFYELIKKYYIDGYGYPKKYYTDEDIDNFVNKGIITLNQAEQIKVLKK